MNNLKVFENPAFGQVRTIDENGKVLFCLTDVAKALGYGNTRDAINRHCKGVVKRDTPTPSGVQSMNFGPEGDVYRLIIHSKLPAAEEFEKWVFDEVLPSIRKTGVYSAPKRYRPHTSVEEQLEAAEIMSGCMTENRPYVLCILSQSFPDLCDVQQEAKSDVQADPTPATSLPEKPKGTSSVGYARPFNADKLIEAIHQRNITPKEFAGLAGVHDSQLYSYLGKRKRPGYMVRKRMCNALNVPIDYFDLQ